MDHNRAASYIWVFPGDTLTVGHQSESIRRLADASGMTVVREYEDEEYGSGPGGRPQFHRTMNAALSESRPFGAVTSYGRWPFAPCAADPAKYVRELQDTGVGLLCAWDKPARGTQAPRRPGTRRSGGGWRPEGPREPAPADPPATWPPTQPNSRAEQPPSLNPTPPPHGESPSTAEVTGPSPPPCENPRSFPALRPGEKSPPEREKEQVVHTNGANGHKHDPCEKRVNPSTFPCRLDLELCACRAKRWVDLQSRPATTWQFISPGRPIQRSSAKT